MAAGMPKGGPGGPGGPGGKPEGGKPADKQPPSDKQPPNAGKPPKKLGLSDATVAIFVYGTNNMP